MRRAAQHVCRELDELSNITTDIPGEMFGRISGSSAVVAAAREFDRSLRVELDKGTHETRNLVTECVQFLQAVWDVDDANASEIGRA